MTEIGRKISRMLAIKNYVKVNAMKLEFDFANDTNRMEFQKQGIRIKRIHISLSCALRYYTIVAIKRLIYAGIRSPTKSVTGAELPLSRLVSYTLFPKVDIDDPVWTLVAMQWGQIITHDMAMIDGTTQSSKFQLFIISSPHKSTFRFYVCFYLAETSVIEIKF